MAFFTIVIGANIRIVIARKAADTTLTAAMSVLIIYIIQQKQFLKNIPLTFGVKKKILHLIPKTRSIHTCYRALGSGTATTCFSDLGMCSPRFERTTFRMRGERFIKQTVPAPWL